MLTLLVAAAIATAPARPMNPHPLPRPVLAPRAINWGPEKRPPVVNFTAGHKSVGIRVVIPVGR